MKLYLIEQSERSGFDTFDAAVVCAASEDEARQIDPSGRNWNPYSGWASSPGNITAKYLGEACEEVTEGVILASFKAG